jgi:hypothetical protein
MFEKTFAQRLGNIGKAFTKAISDYDNLVKEADGAIEVKESEITLLNIEVASIAEAKNKAASISSKLKDIFDIKENS